MNGTWPFGIPANNHHHHALNLSKNILSHKTYLSWELFNCTKNIHPRRKMIKNQTVEKQHWHWTKGIKEIKKRKQGYKPHEILSMVGEALIMCTESITLAPHACQLSSYDGNAKAASHGCCVVLCCVHLLPPLLVWFCGELVLQF